MLRYLLGIAALLVFGRVAQANSYNLDSLKQVVETMPDDSLKCEAFLQIANLLYMGQESVQYGYRALALAKEIGDTRLIGLSYHRIAWCYGYDEMDQKSLYIDSAEQVFKQRNDLNGLGKVYGTKGVFFVNFGAIENGLAAYAQAYDYFLQADNKERQAALFNNWGYGLRRAGRLEEAKEKFSAGLAYRLQEVPEAPIKIARVYYGLAVVAQEMGDLEKATEYQLESFAYRHKVKNIAIAENLIAIALMNFEAAAAGKDTMGIYRKIQDFGLEHSFALLDSASRVDGIPDRPGFIYSIMDARRKGYEVTGNYAIAYDLLQKQKKMDEERKLSASSLEAIADLKVQFEKEQLKSRLLEEEVENRKKNNQVNILLFSLGILASIMVMGFQVYQNRNKTNRLLLAEANQKQQEVAMNAMLEGQETERARIARDLHDGLGNMLSTLKVNVGSLHLHFHDSEAEQKYAKTSEMIDEACTEVRKIAHEMMPQALEKLGLQKALEDLIHKMDNNHSFDAQFLLYGEEKILDDNINVMIYRIVQEVLNNVVKYAEAEEVLLQLTYSEDWLNLSIEDDGKGFDPNNLSPEAGMGLKSIAFRTNYIGGEYEIDSRPGMGTHVSINVPLNDKIES